MNREDIRTLLHRLDWGEITGLAAGDRKVIRILLGFLYDPDDYTHWLAIDALGRVGVALAATHPEKTRELVRRLLWSLNDESGGNAWGATGAIGAIAAGDPGLFGHYLGMMVPCPDDIHACPEFIWAVATAGRKSPAVSREYIPFLMDALRSEHAQIRAYAAWGLGVLGAGEALAALGALSGDHAPAAVYEGDGLYHRRLISELAAAGSARIAAGA